MFTRTFALTWIAYFGYYLCRKNFSVLMPYFKSEAALSSGDLANALFFYSLFYAGGQFLNGWLADRAGSRLVVTAGMLVSAAASAAMAAPWGATLAISLIALQSVNGLAQSTGWPGVLKLTRDWFPEHNRGVILGWWSTHMVLGGFAGTFLAAWVAESGWRRGAWVPAILVISIAAAFFLGVRDKEKPPAEPGGKAKGKLVITPALGAITAMYFCVKMTRYAFLFWLPLYMTEALHYAKPQAGYASSVYELIGFLGVLLAGYVSERRPGSRFMVGSAMMLILGTLCVLYPAASRLGFQANVTFIALIGAFTFGPDTLMAAAALQDVVPAESTGSAAGFVNGVGSVGQLLSPYLVAGLSASLGWSSLFAVLGGMSLLGGVALATQFVRVNRPKLEPAA